MASSSLSGVPGTSDPTVPYLSFDEKTYLNTSSITKLDIHCATKLSSVPMYKDSYFVSRFVTEFGGRFEITRRELDPSPTQGPKFLEEIIEKLMPDDSHFRVEDIKKIGARALGLRHVSSDAQAQREALLGMFNGCSLNISFRKTAGGYSGENAFQDLHEKSTEEIETLLPQFERGINTFIRDSIERYDLGDLPETGGTTFQDLLTTTEKTRFLVVTYSPFAQPTDISSWGEGHGRFSKMSVSSDNIALLKPLDAAHWEIPEGGREQYAFPIEKILDLFVACYRKNLLDHLRAS